MSRAGLQNICSTHLTLQLLEALYEKGRSETGDIRSKLWQRMNTIIPPTPLT